MARASSARRSRSAAGSSRAWRSPTSSSASRASTRRGSLTTASSILRSVSAWRVSRPCAGDQSRGSPSAAELEQRYGDVGGGLADDARRLLGREGAAAEHRTREQRVRELGALGEPAHDLGGFGREAEIRRRACAGSLERRACADDGAADGGRTELTRFHEKCRSRAVRRRAPGGVSFRAVTAIIPGRFLRTCGVKSRCQDTADGPVSSAVTVRWRPGVTDRG